MLRVNALGLSVSESSQIWAGQVSVRVGLLRAYSKVTSRYKNTLNGGGKVEED